MSQEQMYDPTMNMNYAAMSGGSLEGIIYKLGDGRMWDTTEAKWITEVPPGRNPLELYDSGQPATEKYLIECLEFYHFPFGELLDKSVVGLKEALAKLDDTYLTPRTMAGLALGTDEIAKQAWNEHEKLAIPLREALAKLEPNSLEEKMATLSAQ